MDTEEVYSHKLSGDEKDLVEFLLVQLTRPGEDGSFVLSPARLDQFDSAVRSLVIKLSKFRLIVVRKDVDQPEMVALAHEALAGAWPRLHDWLVAAREFRAWQEQLRVAFKQWQDSGQDSGSLLRGAPLATAEDWLVHHPDGITETEQSYIATSRAHRSRGVRRLRIVTAVIGALALAAGLLTVVVVERSNELDDQLRDATASLIAKEAARLTDHEPAAALQLAQAAWREKPGNRDAYSTLLQQYLRWRSTEHVTPPAQEKMLPENLSNPNNLQTSTDGRIVGVPVAFAGRNRLVVWEGLHTTQPRRWEVPAVDVVSFAVSPDGTRLAIADSDDAVSLWDVTRHAGPVALRPRGESAEGGQSLTSMRFSPDTRVLAVGTDASKVEIWDLQTSQMLPAKIDAAPYSIQDAIPMLNAETVAARINSDVIVSERATGTRIKTFPNSRMVGDGSAVVSCESETLYVYNTTTGAKREFIPPHTCDNASSMRTDATGQFLCMSSCISTLTPSDPIPLLHWTSGRHYTLRTPLPNSLDTPPLVGIANPDGGATLLAFHSDTVARVHLASADVPNPSAEGTAIYDATGRSSLRITNDELLLIDTEANLVKARTQATDRQAALAFTQNGTRVLSPSRNELQVYRASDLKLERTITTPLPSEPPGSPPPASPSHHRATVTPLSDHEAVFLYRGILSWWNLDTGQLLAEPLILPSDPGLTEDGRVSLSTLLARPQHGRQLIIATETTVEIWDLDQRKKLAGGFPLNASYSRPTIAVDPTGTRLAVINRDRGVDLWDIDTATRKWPSIVASAPSKASPSTGVVGFSGQLLVLADREGNLQFWRWESNEHIADMKLPIADGTNVVLHGNEFTYFEFGGYAKTRRSFAIDPNSWFERVCQISDREFTDEEATRLPPAARRDRPCAK